MVIATLIVYFLYDGNDDRDKLSRFGGLQSVHAFV